ncbi:hypothetical protein DIE00_20070 [Burkholderia sp. Bp8989]|nr:hypothetical protein DIE05_24340 [Burkholderia sp. Bp8995]RQS45029.1 hypothetical protein DIE00_20070 [Burkholderia sp. Bp8989]
MAGEPDAHDINMKHRPRVPCGDVGASSSTSFARILRIRRCAGRIVADGTISGSRARTGFSPRRTRAADGARSAGSHRCGRRDTAQSHACAARDRAPQLVRIPL